MRTSVVGSLALLTAIAATTTAASADVIDMVAGQNSIKEVSFDTTKAGAVTFTKPTGAPTDASIGDYVAPEADVRLGCRRSGYRAWSLGGVPLGGTEAVVERTVMAQLDVQPKASGGTQPAAAFLHAYCGAGRTDEVRLTVDVLGVCKKVKFALGKTWTHYRTPAHQVSFKVTCKGYEATTP